MRNYKRFYQDIVCQNYDYRFQFLQVI